jgi:hypothetical protein
MLPSLSERIILEILSDNATHPPGSPRPPGSGSLGAWFL